MAGVFEDRAPERRSEARGRARLLPGWRRAGQVRAPQPPAGCRLGLPASPGGLCALLARTPALLSCGTSGNVGNPRESNSHQLLTEKQWPKLGQWAKDNLPSRPLRDPRLCRLGSLSTVTAPEVRPSGLGKPGEGWLGSLPGSPQV